MLTGRTRWFKGLALPFCLDLRVQCARTQRQAITKINALFRQSRASPIMKYLILCRDSSTVITAPDSIGIFDSLLNILTIQVGITIQDFFDGCAMSDLPHDDRHGNPHPANAGSPPP